MRSRNLLEVVLIVSCCVVLSLGEPPLPSPYGRIHLKPPQRSSDEARRIVDQRLLNRVADILSAGGDGSEDPQGQEGASLVDSELFDRVARIISQNSNQQVPQEDLTPGGSGDQTVGPQGVSPFHSFTYGPPPPQVAKLATTIELERPFAARRIASFMLEEETNGLSESYGGSQVPQYAASSDSYVSSLPSRDSQQGNFQRRIHFVGEPQAADSIAAFDVPQSNAASQDEGYNRN